jgi:hypothetical protein
MDPTAKGDLFPASSGTALTRLAVGNNGETLVADSSTSTGLRYQGSIAGGRNALINGGFDFSQRGTSALAANDYTLDRWFLGTFGTSANGLTAQIQTNAAQTGFTNYARIAAGSTTSTNVNFSQSIESSEVRKFQGKTVTVSFKYKFPVNWTAQWGVELFWSTNIDQNISSFASPGATSLGFKLLTNTTSWTSESFTVTVPSTATSLCVLFNTGANTVATAQFDVAQVQLELGSVLTTFSRAGGTIQGELAACQRYYLQYNTNYSGGIFRQQSTTQSYANWPFGVTMRLATPSLAIANQTGGTIFAGAGSVTTTTVAANGVYPNQFGLSITHGAVGGVGYAADLALGTITIGVSAEL